MKRVSARLIRMRKQGIEGSHMLRSLIKPTAGIVVAERRKKKLSSTPNRVVKDSAKLNVCENSMNNSLNVCHLFSLFFDGSTSSSSKNKNIFHHSTALLRLLVAFRHINVDAREEGFSLAEKDKGKKERRIFLHSPTTCRALLAVAVENGDSVVTSHETLPFKLKSTLRKVTWVAFDTDNCSAQDKSKA